MRKLSSRLLNCFVTGYLTIKLILWVHFKGQLSNFFLFHFFGGWGFESWFQTEKHAEIFHESQNASWKEESIRTNILQGQEMKTVHEWACSHLLNSHQKEQHWPELSVRVTYICYPTQAPQLHSKVIKLLREASQPAQLSNWLKGSVNNCVTWFQV